MSLPNRAKHDLSVFLQSRSVRIRQPLRDRTSGTGANPLSPSIGKNGRHHTSSRKPSSIRNCRSTSPLIMSMRRSTSLGEQSGSTTIVIGIADGDFGPADARAFQPGLFDERFSGPVRFGITKNACRGLWPYGWCSFLRIQTFRMRFHDRFRIVGRQLQAMFKDDVALDQFRPRLARGEVLPFPWSRCPYRRPISVSICGSGAQG